LDDYSKKKSGLGGRRSSCKDCTHKKDRVYYEENREGCLERSQKHNNLRKQQRVQEYLVWQREFSKEGLIAQRNHMGTIYFENEAGVIVDKVCRTCGETKRVEDFRLNDLCFGGHHYECVVCEAERARNWRTDNPEKESERKRRHYSFNSDLYKERSLIWQRNNPEKVAEWSRKWQQNNPERVLLNSHRYLARKRGLPDTLTTEQYEDALAYFGNGCALTGTTVNLEKEHAIPLSIGHGGTTFENCYPMANGLNQSKGNKNIFEWFEANRQRFELSQERFNRLIDYLASANVMTVEEYRDHVYWCHANPRGTDEIKESEAPYENSNDAV
jgi:hypothetical protein